MRVGIVLLDRAWPPRSGNHQRDLQIINALTALGHDVHAAWFEVPEDDRLDHQGHAPALGDGSRALGVRVAADVNVGLRLGWKLRSTVTATLPARWSRPGSAYFPFTFRYDAIGACRLISNWVRATAPGIVVLRQSLAHCAAHLRAELGIPIVADCHDVDSVLAQQMVAGSRRWRKVGPAIGGFAQRRLERRYLGSFEERWAASTHDARIIGAYGRTIVVPHAVDDPQPAALGPRPNRLLLVGNMSYLPNFQAADTMAHDILPLIRAAIPDARLDVVGAEMPEAVARRLRVATGVEFHGWVPDLRELYGGTALVCAPLMQGAGPKVKVIEAMAHAVPVVTTTVGVHGLDVGQAQGVYVADTIVELAACCIRLLRDPVGRATAAADARRGYLVAHSPEAVRRALRGSAILTPSADDYDECPRATPR